MKNILLTFLLALTATVSSNAQTLQIDPIYAGGTAIFKVQNGASGARVIVCYSLGGSGPFTHSNGITLDLSMPIETLNPFFLNSQGGGMLGPFPVPNSAVAGMQVWFQGVQIEMLATPVYSVTNMVPITVEVMPNSSPTAVDDDANAPADMPVLLDVLRNDSDQDGDAISVVSVNTPTAGTTLIVNGQVEYTPLAGYVGADSFTYVIEDIFGAQDTATVYVDVIVIAQGSLVSWGNDYYSHITDTPTGNDFTQVAAGGTHAVALRADGSLVAWGDDAQLQVTDTPLGNNFTQVAAGYGHSVALKSDGSLVSWGFDYYSQVTDTPTGNDFTQVTAGSSHSIALRVDGSLVAWGFDASGQVTDTPASNDFTQIAAGASHSIALRVDGSLVSWGNDTAGQVTDTPTGNDFTQVSAANYISMVLKADGSLVSWGHDTSGQVTDTPVGNDFSQVSKGSSHSAVLRVDGSIVSWGYDHSLQVSDTPLGNYFAQVSAGWEYSVAITL